ncbi:aminotransferase class I/II-fold pyridoxal phosphate-dependent enzyme [Kitasatospora sp. NPDC006697]|uniref:aminotransferase class I/II-fold pyridoxal phosphate-dependent enzyme n=1 Tax=Kitasatospora sp. NPDC006697 TaxID=3364020 RepID=UPI0036C0F58D
MDQSQAPVLEALAAFHANPLTTFTPPGHKQGRGTDPRVLEVMGADLFRADVLATGGLDDRLDSRGILQHAQELMAEAVGADHTFFSTCGSSLSVKAAMLAVAGPHEELLVGRDAHKSVVAGLILAGIRPVWVDPQWDGRLHLAHPPSADSFRTALSRHPDVSGVLVTSPTPYGTCADLEAIAEVCHEHGKPLIVDEAWGAHLGRRRGAGRRSVVVDVSALGTTGYRAGDWLRSHHQLTLHICDHRRISAQLTHADDSTTTDRLLRGLTELARIAEDLRPAPGVHIPDPWDLRLEQALLPRDAFFGPTEQVPLEKAAGRIAAEMLTPYPPGIPAAVPGERLTDDVLDYLRSGLEAGMLIPDSADPALDTVRVAVQT